MYKNNKLAKSVRLALMYGAATTALSFNALAQEAPADEEAVEKIEVTGSRIKHADLEQTQPIDMIGSDYISDRGYSNAISAVMDLPGAAFGSNPTIASNTGSNDQGVGQNTIALYGIGSQRTLTLVNGSRFVSSNSPQGGSWEVGGSGGSQVDINNIPVSLIDRVEVVKVGGAPVYGADAVAGVVNFILKKDYEGAEFSYDYRDIDGYGQESSYKALIGGNFDNGKGNLVLSMEHNTTSNIPMRNVPYLANDWTSQAPVEADQVADPSGNVPGNQRRLYPNPRAGLLSFSGLATPTSTALTNLGLGAFQDGNFYQFDPAGSGNLVPFDTGTPANSAVWSSGGDGLDLARTNAAQEGVERYNLTAIANYKLTETTNLNVTAFANSSDGANPGYQAAQYNSGIWNGTDGGALQFSTDHPLLNDQARDLLVGEVGEGGTFYYHRGWINLGAREVINESRLQQLKATLEGELELGDNVYDWEVSYQKGVSTIYSQESQVSLGRFWNAMDVGVNPETGAVDCKYNYVDGYQEALRPGGFGEVQDDHPLGPRGQCVVLNPFGHASQEAIDYVTYTEIGHARMEQNVFSAFIAGPIFELPAGDVQIATGYERRIEKGRFDEDGTGELQGVLVTDTIGSYVSEDIYIEAYVPIISEDMDIPLIRSLSMEGSFRNMDNSQAGEDESWAVGLKYNPIEDLVVTANFAETVRAPGIQELFSPRTVVTAFATDPCDFRNIGNGPNPAVRAANCASEGIPADFRSTAAESSVRGVRGGNPGLLNERAESTNVGIVYAPSWAEGLVLSADWIEIALEDAIVTFTLTDNMDACYDGTDFPNAFCNSFRRQADHQVPKLDAFESGFVNAAFRNFEAYEYQASFTRDLAEYPLVGSFFPATAGELALKLTAFNLKEDSLSNTGFDFTDDTGQYDKPEWRSQFSITHTLDKLTTYVDFTYWGEGARNIESTEPYQYIDQNGNPFTQLDSYTLVNIGAQYQFNDMLTFRLNVENAADWNASPAEVNVDRFAWGRTYNFGVTAKF